MCFKTWNLSNVSKLEIKSKSLQQIENTSECKNTFCSICKKNMFLFNHILVYNSGFCDVVLKYISKNFCLEIFSFKMLFLLSILILYNYISEHKICKNKNVSMILNKTKTYDSL